MDAAYVFGILEKPIEKQSERKVPGTSKLWLL